MTKEQAAAMVLRQMGHPIVQVELTAEEVGQHLDDAAMFLSGYYPRSSLLQIQPTDGRVDLTSQNVLAVADVFFPPSDTNSEFAFFGDETISLGLNDSASLIDASMLSYRLSERMARMTPGFRFESGILYLDDYPNSALVAEVLYPLSGFDDIDSEKYRMWAVRYATALVKIQIGSARSKYTVNNAPVQINGESLLQQGQEEKSRLEEEIQSNPSGFYTILR